MSVKAKRRVSFAPFELDFASGELRKHGIRIRLQEKPFLILKTLLERPGEVVTKEELVGLLWPKDVFVDFDHGLNSALTRLRVALGDSADNPRYLETIPRRGYRFIGALDTNKPTTIAGRAMLAVMPFENLCDDPEQEYFCDGMTEELITQLSRLDPANLGVIARTSSLQYKRTDKSAQQVGSELQVQYLLEGSIRRSKDLVRITAQLIQTSDQTHVWSEQYDHTFDDIFLVQSEASGQIARSLAIELLPNFQDVLHTRYNTDAESYELYLRARYHWNLRIEDGFARALEYFHKVVEKDPKYAPAYAGIADTYNILALYGTVPARDAYQRAKAAAIKALELDDHLAEAHTSLGWARIQHDWDAAGAEMEHLRALELNPNYATGHHWYALYLAEVSRFDEALVEIDRALDLDPLSRVIGSHKGWILYFARRFEAAVTQLAKMVEPQPPFPLAHYFLGLALQQQGRSKEAIAELRKAVELSGNHPGGVSGLCHALALAGQVSEARAVLKRLNELSAERHVSPYFFAIAYTGLGEFDQAFRYLNESCDQRSGWMAHLEIDAQLDPLRGDPRFSALKDRVGLYGKAQPETQTEPAVISRLPEVGPNPLLPARPTGEDFDEMEEIELRSPFVQRARWQGLFYVAVLVGCLALGTGYYMLHPTQAKTRLLVLPMENLGGDPTQVPFVEGMTDELITELDRLNPQRLGVIARTTSTRYGGKSISQLRKELDLDYVIEGSVLHASGERIRISVKLIQARDETQIWANSYEESASEVLDLQRRVATDIARHVAVELVGGATSPRVFPVNPRAHEAFLRGRYLWNRRHLATVQQSIAYFEQAISHDPDYAAPYAGLADAYAVLGTSQSGILPPDVAFPKARDLARKSIALDPTLAEPHASLGLVKLIYERDPEGARQELLRALELDPNYLTAHQWMGQYYIVTGNPKKAIDSVRQALALDPASLPANIALTEAFYFDRDFDAAIEQGLKTVDLDRQSALAHFNLGRAYLMKGLKDQALEEFLAAHRSTLSAATLVPLGLTYGMSGRRNEAVDVLGQLRQIAKTRYVPALFFAMVYTGLNDKENAISELGRAKAEHCDYIPFLPYEPLADPLRNDPRFRDILH